MAENVDDGSDKTVTFPDAEVGDLEAILASKTVDAEPNTDQALSAATKVGQQSIDRINAVLAEAELPPLTDTEGRADVIDALSALELSRTERSVALGIIALTNRPEGGIYRDASVTSHNQESDEQKTWRKAINSLRDLERLPKPPKSDAEPRTAEENAVYTDRVNASRTAHNNLRKLKSPELANSDVMAAVERGAVAILDFDLLLPNSLDEMVKTIQDRLPNSNHRVIDRERVAKLQELCDEFGGVLYLPIDKTTSPDGQGLENFLGNPNPGEYVVAELNIQGKNGAPDRRIAIADRVVAYSEEEGVTSVDGGGVGALYSFEELEDGAGTWQEVYRLSKEDAKQMGANKTVHQGEFYARLRKKENLG